MLEQSYSLKLFSNTGTMILHEKDWETRLGADCFKQMVEANGLVRPSLTEVEGKEFSYYVNGAFIDAEIVIEGDSIFISPVIDGHPVISVRGHDLRLLKFSKETASSYIRKINNLLEVEAEVVHNNKILIVGELRLTKFSALIVWAFSSDVSNSVLESILPKEIQAKYENIIVLSSQETSLEGKFKSVAYRNFFKIPIIALKDVGVSLKCEQVVAHFKYPLVVDTESKFIYVFDKKLGVKKDTNLYKFVLAMANSRSSLPMETETFFRLHQITMEGHETAVKELRSQLKEKIEQTDLSADEKEKALAFFDLVSGEKSRGAVDLKLESHDIQIW